MAHSAVKITGKCAPAQPVWSDVNHSTIRVQCPCGRWSSPVLKTTLPGVILSLALAQRSHMERVAADG